MNEAGAKKQMPCSGTSDTPHYAVLFTWRDFQHDAGTPMSCILFTDTPEPTDQFQNYTHCRCASDLLLGLGMSRLHGLFLTAWAVSAYFQTSCPFVSQVNFHSHLLPAWVACFRTSTLGNTWITTKITPEHYLDCSQAHCAPSLLPSIAEYVLSFLLHSSPLSWL